MRLTELLNTENVTISCELFPPKQGAQLDNYKKIVGDMADSILTVLILEIFSEISSEICSAADAEADVRTRDQ